MKNSEQWVPSKFVYKRGHLVASRDTNEVGPASRLLADLIARVYEENLPEHANGRLLDLGCGKVPLFAAYKDLVTEVVCVDWPNSIHRNVYVDVECDITEPLPLDSGSFDTVLLSDVLEHVPEPERLLREINRVLAPGGKLLMNVPFFYWLHETPHDYYRFTEFALKRLINRSGFELVQFQAFGGVPEIVADILAKTLVRVPWIGRHFAVFTQWAASTLLRTRLGKRVSESTRDEFPFFYFLVASQPKPILT